MSQPRCPLSGQMQSPLSVLPPGSPPWTPLLVHITPTWDAPCAAPHPGPHHMCPVAGYPKASPLPSLTLFPVGAEGIGPWPREKTGLILLLSHVCLLGTPGQPWDVKWEPWSTRPIKFLLLLHMLYYILAKEYLVLKMKCYK